MDFDIWWNSEAADAFRAANEDMSGEVVSPIWDAAVRSASPAAPEAAKPAVLREVALTRDVHGMCVVTVNGREVIRDNGDVISHFATLNWLSSISVPADKLANDLLNCADDYRYLLTITENKDNLHGWLRMRLANISLAAAGAAKPTEYLVEAEWPDRFGVPLEVTQVIELGNGKVGIRVKPHEAREQILAAKPEQQAQAGEPEVAAEILRLNGNLWDVTSKPGKWDHLLADERYTKEPLITLQSHREAMEAESDRVLKLVNRQAAEIAKRNAALKACVEALRALVSEGNGSPWKAWEKAFEALSQGLEAMKS